MSEWWFIGVSPKERKEKSSRKILNLLSEQEASFNDLAHKAEQLSISRATLAKHLKRFVAMGLVDRHVDSSTYPPTVLYRLKSESDVFLPYEVWRALIGEYPHENASPGEVEKWVKAQLLILIAHLALEATPNIKADENFIGALLEQRCEILKKRIYDFCLNMFKANLNREVSKFMVLQYYAFLEEALSLYGLTFDKIKKMMVEGKMPGISKPIKFG